MRDSFVIIEVTTLECVKQPVSISATKTVAHCQSMNPCADSVNEAACSTNLGIDMEESAKGSETIPTYERQGLIIGASVD